jgi:alkanesulfonate monooxygenase SsuD/methylene tetrahydromethanopterin reductase-like flavin-dependent oxidoreductase (luciferase family)
MSASGFRLRGGAVRQHLEQVELARELGFASVWTSQHFLAHPFRYFQSAVSGAADSAEL